MPAVQAAPAGLAQTPLVHAPLQQSASVEQALVLSEHAQVPPVQL
jgi:hypothetical protein